jgi:hypothetical protein
MGLIIRQKEPRNLETPFDQVDSFLTPTELFYIRSHFPAPKLDFASQTSDYGYWDYLDGKARAARIGRNEAEVRDRSTNCL